MKSKAPHLGNGVKKGNPSGDQDKKDLKNRGKSKEVKPGNCGSYVAGQTSKSIAPFPI